ncbi:SDR family oxidoreductase [Subtercola sp. PAMC28395]|uniref:SDR family oxidoreductase n=1 Tax=Subtercola sp. PAMC28395 TaxID=2846775 RepID=UPI00352EADAA
MSNSEKSTPDAVVNPGPDAEVFAPLEGQHIMLTGATGFVGQALLEKLLSDYPTTRMTLLIRPKGSLTGEARLTSLLRKPVFSKWRERVGADEVDRAMRERITVVESSMGSVAAMPADLDVLIHSASTVSFDPPIDEAFKTNVGGAVGLYEALLRTGSDPHVVHVSTAYVGGIRKGTAVEESLKHTVDWRAEMDAAVAARAQVEASSRRPEVLRKLIAAARSEVGKVGPQAIAAAAEQGRVEWVTKRLVDYGRTRAQSLGWADVYALTKSMSERVAEQLWAGNGHRLSVVRPAIIESALNHPFPGWIDGFKVADPLIIAYGRGLLPEFPGLPDSILDIIPVDIVVNATLAVAANPPAVEEPKYYHLSSGGRNPLTMRDIYENVLTYFRANPIPDDQRGHIRAPLWSFPGAKAIARALRFGERTNSYARKTLLRLPSSSVTRDWMRSVSSRQTDLELLRAYSDLYQNYTQAEIIYDDSRTAALNEQLPLSERAKFGFNSQLIDWDHYLQQVHFPAVTTLMRTFSSRPRPKAQVEKPLPHNPDAVAVFDLEGTVLATNIIEQYLWVRLASLDKSKWPAELANLFGSLPRYIATDRRDRGEFLRTFLRRYEGVDEAALRELIRDSVGDVLLQRIRPEAVRQIRKHREAGHRTVLVTGTIDVFTSPFVSLFDEVVASSMHSQNGIWTGYLSKPPLVDEARAAWLRIYAEREGIDLSKSYAYGDSHADRAWLELVGNPQAVNPDAALYQHATVKHWRIHQWTDNKISPIDTIAELLRPAPPVTVAEANRPQHELSTAPSLKEIFHE